jgi:hypothetical protein
MFSSSNSYFVSATFMREMKQGKFSRWRSSDDLEAPSSQHEVLRESDNDSKGPDDRRGTYIQQKDPYPTRTSISLRSRHGFSPRKVSFPSKSLRPVWLKNLQSAIERAALAAILRGESLTRHPDISRSTSKILDKPQTYINSYNFDIH